MRILIFNETAAAAGGEMNQYVLDVAARLRAAGDVVALVHAREPEAEFDGTRYVFDHLDRFRAPEEEVRLRLEAILDDFGPDVAQIHGVGNVGMDVLLAERVPTARFIHNHRFYCSGANMTWRRPRRACREVHGRGCLARHAFNLCGAANPAANLLRYRRVTAALRAFRSLPFLQVASRLMRDNLVRNGFDASRVVELPLYAPPPSERGPAGVPGRRTIVHQGGMVRHKGVWLLARGLASLPDDVDLVFPGSGRLQGPLERFAKARGITDRIRVVGEVDGARRSRLFHACEMVVLPSMWNEPLGLAGLHAMAHGKPVVAFQCDGIGEWLQDGVTGVAVPFGDRAGFLARVAEALGDRARLAEMGAAGRKAWEERFRPEHHLARLREFYKQLQRAA